MHTHLTAHREADVSPSTAGRRTLPSHLEINSSIDGETTTRRSTLNGIVNGLHRHPSCGSFFSDSYADSRTSSLPPSGSKLPTRASIEHINVFIPEDLSCPPSSSRVRHPNHDTSPGSSSMPLCLTGWASLGGPGEIQITICDCLSYQEVAANGLTPLDSILHAGSDAKEMFGVLGSVGNHPSSDVHHEYSRGGYRDQFPNFKGKGKARQIDVFQEQPAVWLVLASQAADQKPQLRSISFRLPSDSPGVSQRPDISLILYQPPNPSSLRFLSLEPLALTQHAKDQSLPVLEDDDLGAKFEMLVAARPHRWFEVTGGFAALHGPGSGLRQAIELINSCHQYRLDSRQPSQRSSNTRRSSWLTPWGFLQWLGTLADSATASNRLHRNRLGFHPATYLIGTSATALQIHHRLCQIASLPTSAATLRHMRRHEKVPIRHLAARYISVWNGIWLIANDLILGWAVGSILCDYHSPIAARLADCLEQALSPWLLEALRWLDHWPGGLKLNTELSAFYADMYCGLVSLFQACVLSPVMKVLPLFIYYIGLASKFMGLSITICLFSDLTKVLTMHIAALHALARTQYKATLHLLFFLLLLFRGKKRNIMLGSRSGSTSSAMYEMDQLLLGTILFTLVLFLSPTLIVYHILFACTRLVQEVLIGGICGSAVKTLNDLPLFAVMLLMKDGRRMPGGVWLEPLETDTSAMPRVGKIGLDATTFRLHSTPLSLTDVLTSHDGGTIATARGNLAELTGMIKAICSGRPVGWGDAIP